MPEVFPCVAWSKCWLLLFALGWWLSTRVLLLLLFSSLPSRGQKKTYKKKNVGTDTCTIFIFFLCLFGQGYPTKTKRWRKGVFMFVCPRLSFLRTLSISIDSIQSLENDVSPTLKISRNLGSTMKTVGQSITEASHKAMSLHNQKKRIDPSLLLILCLWSIWVRFYSVNVDNGTHHSDNYVGVLWSSTEGSIVCSCHSLAFCLFFSTILFLFFGHV